jgi:tyrosine-protein phosphatase YwqE
MSFFRKIFHREPKQETTPIDLSLVGVDMHSHLLPGIDDGAVDLENSMVLITQLHELGYKRFITTPHIFQDLYPNTPATILPKLALVKLELKMRGIEVEIEAAAEYYLDEVMEKLIEEKALLTFGNNNVLFEISFVAEPANLHRGIFNMQLQGYKPILAHPERYEYWHHDFSKYEAMVDKEVLLQLNVNCLTGHYGPGVKKISERLIDAGMISFIGSDCHHVGHTELLRQVRTNPHLKKLVESGKLRNSSL